MKALYLYMNNNQYYSICRNLKNKHWFSRAYNMHTCFIQESKYTFLMEFYNNFVQTKTKDKICYALSLGHIFCDNND